MKRTFLSIFAHMDWVDWLLVIGFLIAFTVIGYSLISFPYWLVFPVIGLVLLYLAKSRRDRYAADRSDKESPPDK